MGARRTASFRRAYRRPEYREYVKSEPEARGDVRHKVGREKVPTALSTLTKPALVPTNRPIESSHT